MSVKGLEELTEMALGVMRARRGFRMVLHGKDGVLPVPYTFDRMIIEVKVRDLKRLRTRHPRRIALDRKSVVLRGDKYMTR